MDSFVQKNCRKRKVMQFKQPNTEERENNEEGVWRKGLLLLSNFGVGTRAVVLWSMRNFGLLYDSWGLFWVRFEIRVSETVGFRLRVRYGMA